MNELPQYYDLLDGAWAILFPYHVVTDHTLFLALPRHLKGKEVKYKQETLNTAGRFRMDSEEIKNAFPIETAFMIQADLPLEKYVLVKV